ncbi:zinc finger protein-like [Tropilaelaps mercedesae]|uniref:Zinc finger protein-like 1 homolog n=1 Tax=Tropilaelaps mercedesae TaxID=418985 RepID=A0A1V9Y1V8_9ACAR|nr:zinc finger protein-like [Tropilaelaps mercedesae]
MGLCRCAKRKVTTQFCYEHRVNVCESCMVNDHPNCIVQGYLQWLKDSDYEPVCTICRKDLSHDECIRLLCYHVFHWRCLDDQLSKLPLTTAPAGYTCPTCGHEVIPRDNVVSPVADIIRTKLQRARWATPGDVGASRKPSSSRQHDKQNNLHQLQDSRSVGSLIPLDSSWASQSLARNGPTQSSFMEYSNNNPHSSAVNVTANNTMSSRGPASTKQGVVFYDNSMPSGAGRSLVSTQKPLSCNEDEDKYKRKTSLELIHRWLQSKIFLGGRRRGDPSKRWAAIIVAIAASVFLLVYFMSRVGRSSAELDPMLSPNFNPAIRSRDK